MNASDSRAFSFRVLLGLALCASAVSAEPRPGAGAGGAEGTEAGAPNIVVIVADDLGYGDLGCYGAKRARTPHIDRLAAEGARFTSFYANSPVCSPTRASLLTGLYPAQTGVLGALTKPRPGVGGLRDDVVLLPRLLREHGYRSGHFGKWHLGEEPADRPGARGFDAFFGFLRGASYGPDFKGRLLAGDEPAKVSGCLTELVTDRAIAFVREHVEARPAAPLLLFVAHKAVHGSISEGAALHPERVREFVKEGAVPGAAEYLAVLEDLDESVGRLVQALEELELTENTLVLFLSDNGPALDQPGASSGGLRFGKGVISEGGTRVPCIARWPGRVKPGLEIDATASTVDVFATALAAAGRAAPLRQGDLPIEGLDLRSLFAGEPDPRFEARSLFWFDRQGYAVRQGRWKLFAILPNKTLGEWGQALERWDQGTFRLYDIATDPGETADRAAEEPEVLAALQAELRRRLVEAQGAGATPAGR